jgi:hypothetical protein
MTQWQFVVRTHTQDSRWLTLRSSQVVTADAKLDGLLGHRYFYKAHISYETPNLSRNVASFDYLQVRLKLWMWCAETVSYSPFSSCAVRTLGLRSLYRSFFMASTVGLDPLDRYASRYRDTCECTAIAHIDRRPLFCAQFLIRETYRRLIVARR